MSNNNNEGLLRGNEDLFYDNSVDPYKETIIDLKLDQIHSNPYQPRQKFEQSTLNDLAKSIKKSGVFQPIIVRQSDSDISRYEILAGERRFRASKMIKNETIPTIIRNITESQMMEIAVLENLQREDLSPLEEAEAYDMLMKNLHLTQTQVSSRIGKSRPYIANYLRLLGLPIQVKELLQKKKLSMGQARTLLSLRNHSKIVSVAHRASNGKMTVRTLEKVVNKLNNQVKNKSVKKTMKVKAPYLRASENMLQNKFDTSVSIKESNNSGYGKIEFEYLSENDLNRILELLDVHLD